MIKIVKVREDLTGKVFGRLTVLEQANDYVSPLGEHYAQWLCECSCPEHKRVIVVGSNLKKKNGTRSCGCINKEKLKEMEHKRAKENKRDLSGDFGILWTTDTNKEVYFDLEDAEKILEHTWWEDSHGYATTCIDGKFVMMHRFLGYYRPDHHNRNRLDNRKENLVPCSIQENNRNSSIRTDNTSGVIGVSWSKLKMKWKAYIHINKKLISLGSFDKKDDAIIARLKAEKKYFGEFAPQKHLYEQYGITEEDDNDGTTD